MNKPIENIRKVRLYLLDQIKDLSIDQLNDVPPGFKNNIIWNLGHLIAAQQGLCYLRSGLPSIVEEKYILPYKPGTKPERYVDGEEIEVIKEQMLTSLDQFERDYESDIFKNYTPFTTRYGVELTNIHEALTFVYFHEGLHSGVIMSLKKLETVS